jgi:sugar phosphate isomerase/epimerase
MKLACSTQIVPGNSISEKAKKALSYGFEGLEIRLLEHEVNPKKIKEIKSALDDNGIPASSFVMPGEFYGTPLVNRDVLEKKIVLSKKALDTAALLGCPTIVCPEYNAQNPLPLWNHPVRPTEEEHALLIEYLSVIAEYAEQLNVIALVEPINRYETHFYYTLSDGKKIIDEIGKASLCLLADFFHMNLEEANMPESILACGSYIRHVQLGDSNRLLPGQGHTDFRSAFAALKEIGYKWYMALECSVIGNPDIVLPECVKFLKKEMLFNDKKQGWS